MPNPKNGSSYIQNTYCLFHWSDHYGNKRKAIGRAEEVLRELFQFVYNCDYTDVTREDFELDNEKSKEVISRYGELELSILDGSNRSVEAPQMLMRALDQIKYLNGQHQSETEDEPLRSDTSFSTWLKNKND